MSRERRGRVVLVEMRQYGEEVDQEATVEIGGQQRGRDEEEEQGKEGYHRFLRPVPTAPDGSYRWQI
ncbi:MAG TPA: hypothetical protein VJA27_01010 [Patescibacteria group bacterium]|nr:hypothetical protein [Patescibacteria group bacterium]